MNVPILITGGAGYIGSHLVARLRRDGRRVVVLDDLSGGHADAVPEGTLVRGSIHDGALLDELFQNHHFGAVIHLAAFIEAGRSVAEPEAFRHNNVKGTRSVLDAALRHGVNRLVFPSTAGIYAAAATPLAEDSPVAPLNPYAASKAEAEALLAEAAAHHGLKVVALRFFNAAGADPEGKLSERHQPETHLIPLVLEVAEGRRAAIHIHGEDYPTADGTCVRDYVHVCDLAEGYRLALADDGPEPFLALNLGTGRGHSVQQVIETARRVTGHPIPALGGPRRSGDPASLVADCTLARRRWGWNPTYPELESMIAHAWRARRSKSDWCRSSKTP